MVYAYLVFTRYLVRIDLSGRTGRLEKVADFLKQNLPVCPAVFPHDSKVYFVGGEKFNESCERNLAISSTPGLDTSYGDKGRSARVYVLGSDNRFYRDSMIPNTNAAKVKPMVATLNGKIYALSTCSNFDSSIELPYPVFECYDSSSTGLLCSWETLPDPPHYRENDYADDNADDEMMRWGATSITNMFVFENMIFIKNCFGVSYYHTCDREWKTLPCDDWIDTSTPSPFMGDCFAQGKDGVVVAFTKEKKMLMAYMFDDQLLKFHQELVDLYLDIPFSLPRSPFGFIRHFGNNRFCFVIFEGDDVGGTTAPFVVVTFKIRTIPEDGHFVFNATILNFQRCFLDPTVPFGDDRDVHDIFIM